MNSPSLAIIGSSGRTVDGPRFAANPPHFLERMKAAAMKVIDVTSATTLVSGGAAWSDHIAVMIFLENPERFNLVLELPAPLLPRGEDGLAYEDKGMRNYKINPGGTSNYYHDFFALEAGKHLPNWSPYKDLKLVANHPKVQITVTHGFDARNSKVAKADHCIAMTFGKGHLLNDGGTYKTMREYLARKSGGLSYHLDLFTCKLWSPAEI